MAERYDDHLIGNEHPRRDNDESSSDTNAIRADIAETRERMSETLDEIGHRLNPNVVKEQVTQRVKEGIREATIGRVEHMARTAVDKVNDTRYSLTDTIRENPVPAALVAIGLGWLMVNRRSSSDYSRNRSWDSVDSRQSASYGLADYDDTSAGHRSRVADMAETARERVSDVAGAARERVTDVAGRAKHSVTDAGHAARERAGMLADRARGAAGNVRTQAQHLASSAADTTRRSAARVEDMYHENPLALGAVTMALGVAAGFAVPRTDREVQFFGDARDQVVDRVHNVVDETKEKVQHVASRVMNEAKTAAREEGLPGAS
jgi:ElaB/YqjD/DUF883 family membrane-anchored ribosome-binding protein